MLFVIQDFRWFGFEQNIFPFVRLTETVIEFAHFNLTKSVPSDSLSRKNLRTS